MKRRSVVAAGLALAALGAAGGAAAHHPPRFDRCGLLSAEGRVVRLDWTNPHVGLAVTAADGATYDLVWLNLQQLALAGIGSDTLKIGDRVEFKAGARPTEKERPLLLAEIRRLDDGWSWAQTPQGC